MDFIKELLDEKTRELNIVKDLIINTIKAKALYKKGGWALVNKELGNNYCNPNFGINPGTLYNKLRELNKNVSVSIQQNMGELVTMVNNELKHNIVEYKVDRLHHYIRITL